MDKPKKSIRKKMAFIMAVCLIVFMDGDFTSKVWAEKTAQTVGFSVKAVQSEKQINERATYFDLLLTPGETHVLEVDIYNSANQPMEVAVAACTAGTSPSGVIEYDRADVNDDSLNISFEKIATVDNPLVTIPAKSTHRIAVTVQLPEASFEGVLLGGIVVKKVEADNQDKAVLEAGTRVINEYAYVIGVKIVENEEIIAPDFKLLRVEPILSNYHVGIAANLQNNQAAMVKGLSINAQIYHNQNPQPRYTRESENFEVAPNSNFDYVIPSEGRLAAGDYRLALTARLGERIWEFDETFSITASAASEINESSVEQQEQEVNYYRLATIGLSILLLVILLGFLFWLLWFKRRKERQDKSSEN